MTKEQMLEIYKPTWYYRGRSLENYKSMHAKDAASKGVSEALAAAKTLTQARKIMYGYKRGNVR